MIKKIAGNLFYISVVILFIELLLIRWISTEINIFAYLQNSILVVCFLGIGMGCFANKPDTTLNQILEPLTILTICLCVPFLNYGFKLTSLMLSCLQDFVVWSQGSSNHSIGYILLPFFGLFLTIIVLYQVWNVMFPLGCLLGRQFSESRAPILSYSANIFGSLVGVWLFTLLSFMSLPPYIWFFVLALLFVPFILDETKKIKSILLVSVLVILPLFESYVSHSKLIRWSPYQKLDLIDDVNDEYLVTVNNSGFQQIQDNSESYQQTHPELFPENLKGLSQYDIPARLFPDAKNVLILGTGTGNDVAGLLRNNKNANVKAVEIDPVVVELGNSFNNEKPYSSQRVSVEIDDARSFFAKTNEKFDLIIFGLLDSHTTPVQTNARLDNFVYTTESLKRAYELLNDKGVLVLIFQPTAPFIYHRINQTLKFVTNKDPLVFWIQGSESGWGGATFVVGNQAILNEAFSKQNDLKQFVDKNIIFLDPTISAKTLRTTDDWPYFYLSRPMLPKLFYFLSFAILIVCYLGSKKISFRFDASAINYSEVLHFAALGAAFSLIETFGVCKASILFGSTWIVNSCIISAVLVMILLSNIVASINSKWVDSAALIGVILSPVFLYNFDFDALNNTGQIFKLVISGIFIILPVFFSGIIFTRSFSKTQERGIAMGANLFGALIGGLLQLLSFLLGIKALLIIALVTYIIAVITVQRDVIREKQVAI